LHLYVLFLFKHSKIGNVTLELPTFLIGFLIAFLCTCI